MFDIGWSELLIIGVVAVVVIGPKDLPKVMRAMGIYAGKARGLAREFQGQWDEMLRQSELEEMKKQVDKLGDSARDIGRSIDPSTMIGDIDISGPPAPPADPAAARLAETVTAVAVEVPAEEPHVFGEPPMEPPVPVPANAALPAVEPPKPAV